MLANISILLPFVLAIVSLLLPQKSLKSTSLFGSVLLLAASLLSIYIFKLDAQDPLLTSKASWISALNSQWFIDLDGMSLLMYLLTAVSSLFIFASIRTQYTQAFYALVWVMIGAMIGVFTAKDGLLFYVFWELALIPIYFILLMWGGDKKGKITFKFFVYTLAGSLFMLAGFIYLFQQSGSWEIGALYDAGRKLPIEQQTILFWAIFVGFAIKMPIFPFHTWQPDTYATAPTQGTMLLSGIMLKMGTYGVIRWLLPMVPAGVASNAKIAIILSIIGIVYASLIAINQRDIKRLIAWSSIAHVGLISAGMFTLNHEGLKGAFVQMFAHGINVIGLFYIVDILCNRLRTTELATMGGIRGVSPKFALLFLFILLGSVGLPLTNGFIGEFLLLNAVYQYNIWYALVAGLTVILGAVYMLRAYQSSMLGEANETTLKFANLNKYESWTLVSISVLIILLGLFPNMLIQLVDPGVDALINNTLGNR